MVGVEEKELVGGVEVGSKLKPVPDVAVLRRSLKLQSSARYFAPRSVSEPQSRNIAPCAVLVLTCTTTPFTMALQHLQSEGLCLRYPENLGTQPNVSQEMAVSMLLRATHLSTQTPVQWTYIDRPNGESAVDCTFPVRTPSLHR